MIGRPIPAQMAVDAKSVTTPTCTAATLHRVTGPPILKPSQKFHSSGVPHHRPKTKETKQTKKRKNRVFEAVVVLGQKNKK